MTGYESKKKAAQDKLAQDMEFARIEIQVGNKLVQRYLTRQELHNADQGKYWRGFTEKQK